MTTTHNEVDRFRIVRILIAPFLANAIISPFLIIILPLPAPPPSTAVSFMSLVMMILMPFELVLVYILYRFLEKKTNSENIPGIAALLYMTGTIPSVYGFVIGFTDPIMRTLGVLMGLLFGLTGMFLAWTLINRIWESISLNPL